MKSTSCFINSITQTLGLTLFPTMSTRTYLFESLGEEGYNSMISQVKYIGWNRRRGGLTKKIYHDNLQLFTQPNAIDRISRNNRERFMWGVLVWYDTMPYPLLQFVQQGTEFILGLIIVFKFSLFSKFLPKSVALDTYLHFDTFFEK